MARRIVQFGILAGLLILLLACPIVGTGLTASITFGDKPEHEIMSALVYYSAGLCRIE